MSPMAPSDDVVLATVRDFTDRSGAVRVVVVLDRGEDRAAPVIECEPGEPVTIGHAGEIIVVSPADLVGVSPIHVHLPVSPIPATALEFDPALGQATGPIGAVEALALAVKALASELGGRTVAVADFATRSGEQLSIAARPGEPIVLGMGDEQFELPTQGPGPVT